MMDENDSKNVLLSTYMHELPLSKRIKRRFDPNRALTLREFIKLNPLLRYEDEGFVGPGRDEYYFFYKNSLMWKELKEFLIAAGFNSSDWAMLMPDKKNNRRKDFSSLSKIQILSLPVCMLCSGSGTSNMFNITVKDLLKKEYAYYDKKTITLQKRLRELGFSEVDGPFMEITKKDPQNVFLLKRARDINIRKKYSDYGLCL